MSLDIKYNIFWKELILFGATIAVGIFSAYRNIPLINNGIIRPESLSWSDIIILLAFFVIFSFILFRFKRLSAVFLKFFLILVVFSGSQIVIGSFVQAPWDLFGALIVALLFIIARNVLVRIGTPIKDILDYCGLNAKSDIYKVIMGGPMTGVAQYSLDAPVIKGSSGILVMDRKFKSGDEINCIRCSRCVDACPAGIMPCMIASGVKFERFDVASSYNPLDCIECGSCSYVCPSKIPLVQLIKLAKTKIKR